MLVLAFCIHTHTRPHTQSQYSYAGPAPKFFEECETYWAPSSQANELYEQLATRKYREILREQIQCEEIIIACIDNNKASKMRLYNVAGLYTVGGGCYNHHGNVCIMKSYCSPGSPSS